MNIFYLINGVLPQTVGSIADTLTGLPTSIPMPSMGTMLFKTTLGLVLVIALIYFVLWLFRNLTSQGKFFSAKNSRLIEIIPMGAKQSLYVIHLYGQIYILAVCGQNISIVDKISDPTKIAEIMQKATEKKISFSSVLGKFKEK